MRQGRPKPAEPAGSGGLADLDHWLGQRGQGLRVSLQGDGKASRDCVVGLPGLLDSHGIGRVTFTDLSDP